ncbi:Sodium-dependent nutrient amino acid transporter 1 [Orchesella cincta]|uniref:Sodium-dependent nutrient amino acid transporter 1 n=1 Tax=Orchesella cincta TaxID=48709 RepID=A0A1D2N425_ORCCI|nr:Sodium-dependent nutrient amino acid transporter 1 [Orchesella cincta]
MVLIPYLIVLFFIGKPIYFLELSIGQFCSYGQVKCWEMSPFFKGVGYGSTLCSFCVVTYYCSVMALTVFYFFASFQTTLPWSACDPSWAGEETCEIIGNLTTNETSGISLPLLYFENEVLKQKVNIDDGIGYPDWRLSLCLFVSWLAVFFSIVRGVQSSGKVAYFTAIYPYVVLLVLLVTGCAKPGAWTGIKYFITPQWDKIYDPNVWYAAVGQCFFSLSTGFGPIIMYASYNPFRHNVHRDALIVSIMDTFTSFLAGLTVFSILGNLAYQLDKDVSEVVDSGPGLVFVSYPDAISKFTFVPQLFAVLFFLMLFSLGVGSAVSWQMAVITVICDQFPKFSKVYCIGIAWFYGLGNVTKDIEFMLGIKLHWYWKICWGLVVPIVLSVILVYSLATAKPLTHNGAEFPVAAIVCGWILAAACLLFIPAGIIYAIWKSKGGFRERLKESIRPTKEWGPHAENDRAEWEIYKANKLK